MAIDVKFFTISGSVSSPNDGLLWLDYDPTTGPNSDIDIAVDPIGGSASRIGKDFGITGAPGVTGKYLTYNLENSDIKLVREENIAAGETGPVLRVLYNY